MIKKIKTNHIRLGMYIHDLCGDWIDHPFWKKSFKLIKQKDLDTMLKSNITEVMIDTSKGLDVVIETPKEVVIETPMQEKTDPAPETVKTNNEIEPLKKLSIQEELVAAKKIHTKTKQAVVSMFGEIRMGNVIKVDSVAPLVDEINQSMTRNTDALLSLVRLKNVDEYTYLHSVAVCTLMVALGRQLGLEGDLLKQAGIAGLFHDVGKMAIPNEVLYKPGRLTDDEFNIVKAHPLEGWKILKESADVSESVLDVCLHHHERVDGTGYPDKLSGEALTLLARMGAVCDVYDAITSERCYKKGWEPADAIRKMAEWKDGHFDERVFHAFVKTLGIYPVNSLLKLKSERLAIVIERSESSLITPIIKVFFSTRVDGYIKVEEIDLSKSTDSIASVEDPRKWGFDLEKIKNI